MTRKRKLTAATVVSGALAAAVVFGAAGAIAASGALSPREESEAVIDDAASRLGVEPGALGDALKEALESRVDAAVEAGRLTEAEGKALRARIDSGNLPLLFGALGGHGMGHVDRVGHFDAAASYLGLDEAELRDRLGEGKSLADIAKAEGKPVDGLVQALVKEAETRLDAAVADGRLTRDQANELADGLEARITALVNGERPERPFGRGFGPEFGPGFGHHSGSGHAWGHGPALGRHGPFA
jgi:hypothetical protein